MSGYQADDGSPLPKKKSGSARTSKKPRRRNAIPYTEWSGEQGSVNSSPAGVQQHAQDVEDGFRASPEPAGEAMTHVASENIPGNDEVSDHQVEDACPHDSATAPGLLSPPDGQEEDALTRNSHIPMASKEAEDCFELQEVQEEQKADDWPSENMRPNAQNLRYGGYPTQPAPQNRNTPLGSARLQNTTKLGAIECLASRGVQWNADAF